MIAISAPTLKPLESPIWPLVLILWKHIHRIPTLLTGNGIRNNSLQIFQTICSNHNFDFSEALKFIVLMITCNLHYEMLLWYLRNEVATLKRETVWDGLTLTKDLQTWLHILLLHMHSRVQLPELDKYTFITNKYSVLLNTNFVYFGTSSGWLCSSTTASHNVRLSRPVSIAQIYLYEKQEKTN